MAAATRIVCPHCGSVMKSDREGRPGKKVKCVACRASFQIPATPAVPVAVGVAPPPPPIAAKSSSPASPRPAAWRMPLLGAACAGVLCLAGLAAIFLWAKRHAPTPPGASPASAETEPVAIPESDPAANAAGVRAILEKNCFRCHGQDDEAEAGVYVLDRDRLLAKKKVFPGDPDGSRLYQRLTSDKRPMPPRDEIPRPSPEEIAQVKQWIAGGAPPFGAGPANAPGSLDAAYLLTTMRDYLLKTPEQDRKFQRFFTLCHLSNNPLEAGNLPVYRAALAKVVNSLSWKKKVVQPRAVDNAQTVYALDLRDVDWETPDRWQEIVRAYPYGLRYESETNAGLRSVARAVERLTGQALPYVRADWFVATASRPPLYHSILALPNNARQLEQQLGVNLQADFLDGKLRRAGFLKSNVSSQNRMIERHDSLFGAYWKSYDFRSSQNRDNLITFPLGPGPAFIPAHPFPGQAFEQAGGEIIFNLPNGLQGYMLVDGRDNRIDVAPIEVVRDREETSGTPQIVNGLSCMACHVNGMITGDNLKDVIRAGSAADGAAKRKVEQLYAPQAEMDQLLQKDEERFLRALKRAVDPNQQAGAEPVSVVARPFLKKGIDLRTAAFELGLPDPQVLKQAILTNRTLRQLGLEPLAQDNAIQRASWELLQDNQSVFQRVASELGLGTPVR